MGCGCGCSDSGCDENKEVRYIKCPDCGSKSKSVPYQVLNTMVKKNLKDDLLDNNYFICLNPECETVYVDETKKSTFKLNQLNKPVWFKKGSLPKIACYCNNITYDQVEKAVREENLTSWKDIILNYKSKAICMCEKLNPTGECCSDNFYQLVNKVLKGEGRQAVSSSSNCCG
ncbi:MAG: (2Fe-2S)-binding protein [Halanaerobiales bacterium]|nr:(2Fe-2S)-binding protein [Halanaerobiales bacterium]